MVIELQKLTPDLYRSNAFRILGLPSSVSFKGIHNRGQRLITAIEMEDVNGIRRLTIGTMMGKLDEPLVRSATDRLGDPHKRLVDELFWFRSFEEEEATFQLLRSGTPENLAFILACWEIDEDCGHEDDATAATHNLAVFHHMLAIEIENQIAALMDAESPPATQLQALKDLAEYCWKISLPRWRRSLMSDRTWAWLQDRALSFDKDKRRIKDEDIDSMRRDAQAAILGIILQLMKHHGQRERLGEVDRIRSIILAAGFADGALSSATQSFCRTLIQDVENRVGAFEILLRGKKESVKDAVSHFLDDVEPRIKVIHALLPATDSALEAVENSFAKIANDGQIAYWKSEHDDNYSLSVLNRIKPYIHSPQLLEKVNVDIEDTVCMFCKKRARSRPAAYKVDMWRILDVQPITGQYRLSTQTIPVPRCEGCANTGSALGAAAHRSIKAECAAGWRLGSKPTPQQVHAAFQDASLWQLRNLPKRP